MLVGSQQPRILVAPRPRLWTEGLGPGAEVAHLAAECGVVLDPWQRLVLDVGLADGPDGLFEALEVCLLVPRQNGKSALLAALAIGAVVVFGARLVIYSAHEFKTALETYQLVSRMVQDGPLRDLWLKDRRSGVETGIEFQDGARIRFVARSRSSGRGFTSDLVILDEAFALHQEQLGAILPTLSARPNPQVWLASSAAMHDSDALHRLMRRAKATRPGRLALLDWSVVPGTDLDDRAGWARSNPGLGFRLTERFIETERDALSAREFERERLGVPDDEDGVTGLNMDRWLALLDEGSETVRPLGFGLDVTPERDASAITLAGGRTDGLTHVEVVDHLAGTEWVQARAVELWNRWKTPFWIESPSPAKSFVGPLTAKGVEVKTIEKGGGADPLFADGIENGTIRHLGQSSLTSALTGSARHTLGDTWHYSRQVSSADICPLKAAALAHYGAMVEPPPPPKRKARIL